MSAPQHITLGVPDSRQGICTGVISTFLRVWCHPAKAVQDTKMHWQELYPEPSSHYSSQGRCNDGKGTGAPVWHWRSQLEHTQRLHEGQTQSSKTRNHHVVIWLPGETPALPHPFFGCTGSKAEGQLASSSRNIWDLQRLEWLVFKIPNGCSIP